MKSSTYILMRVSMVIVSASGAVILVNDIAGTHWFGGYDKAALHTTLIVLLLMLPFMDPVAKEARRRRQARIANPDAYPRRTFSNTQRFTILGIAALPSLIIAANCFFGSNWFGHYGLIAVAASIGLFVIVNSLVYGPKRGTDEGQRLTTAERSGTGSD